MAARVISPEHILPTRMSLHVPAASDTRFSVLDFPYANALKVFMGRFKDVYRQKHNKDMPYSLYLPYRQLNDALLTLAPGLIQAFEKAKVRDEWKYRMVAFTHDTPPEDFPSLGQLKSLIRHWVERWGEHPDVEPLLKTDGKAAWKTLMEALNSEPETEWEHGIRVTDLATDLNNHNGLAYIALPALLTSMLHTTTMNIQSEKGKYTIKWRRVNHGGKNGLYLVSQPFPFEDDYFAYCIDFSVQNQSGYVDDKGKPRCWIFAHLSIQRYIAEKYDKGDEKRDVSVLVGYNREHFDGGWEDDTTLIRLGVEKRNGKIQWTSGVGALLRDFSIREPLVPDDLFKDPYPYGNYKDDATFAEDEYYLVYAEGRKFGDGRERSHQVKTGTSLRERSQIMADILSLLNGWLQVSLPLERDIQNPKNTFALRDYEHMVKENKASAKKRASWRTTLQTSLNNGGHDHLHVVVLHRSETFETWAKKQMTEALMGVDSGENPLATVTYHPLPPLLYAPLYPGNFDPEVLWLARKDRPADFDVKAWYEQMRESYRKKREEWREFLQSIAWQPNARRLILIDSNGEFRLHDSQKIKGAVREACVREGISSQFIVGNLKLDGRAKFQGRLDGQSGGRLQNAVLDLIVRQQGILYAPPCEIYKLAAKLDAETASQLDVISFCRVKRNNPKFNYVLAVKLRAGGEVDVLLPGAAQWLSYDKAAHQVGTLFAENRSNVLRERKNNPLVLDHGAMVQFVEHVLTKRLERPTIAVIEAVGWRNRSGDDEQKHCWTQLQIANLFKNQDVLQFETNRVYRREAPILDNLLCVVRLRMNDETPQYIPSDNWADEEVMRDIEHLTGYVDPCVTSPFHYMSLAGLSEGQKDQRGKNVREAFKGDVKGEYDNIAFKHAQLIELVPFFGHPNFQDNEKLRQLCRCVHFLRISPGFTMGEIALPFPMHLGNTLIKDMLTIIGMDD